MSANRIPKSFSVETGILEEVERTRGTASTSERINQLLKTGLEAERSQSLHREAAEFFASHSEQDDQSRRAFQTASMKSITRD